MLSPYAVVIYVHQGSLSRCYFQARYSFEHKLGRVYISRTHSSPTRRTICSEIMPFYRICRVPGARQQSKYSTDGWVDGWMAAQSRGCKRNDGRGH
ncbi:unnamed protein product [Periconia digitata]|uniref:Uncharacterized protein n=1 Tax=Periconia digitata TaxID=1303443 RepID=A0A9W4UQQ9_9PLEO|nr:unnamed protein product [Periconia digitata]